MMTLSLTTKFNFNCINILISFVYYVLFMSVLSTEKIDRKGILVFADYYKIFILYACILNFIINRDNLLDIVEITSAYDYNFSSFFTNRNTFAAFLLVGVMLSFYSVSIRKSKFDLKKRGRTKVYHIFYSNILRDLLVSFQEEHHLPSTKKHEFYICYCNKNETNNRCLILPLFFYCK